MGSGSGPGGLGEKVGGEGKLPGPGELESEAPPIVGPVKVYCGGSLSWVRRCSPLGSQHVPTVTGVLRAVGGGPLAARTTAVQAAEGVTSCVPFQGLSYCALDPHGEVATLRTQEGWVGTLLCFQGRSRPGEEWW